MSDFYARLSAKRGDDAELTQCIERVVNQLSATQTSMSAPGMLLGKIQSGKTRGFLGVIAKSFDRGFDIAIVLTKGTKTLVKQTVQRIESEFEDFIELEEVLLFDVMHMPQEMTKSERRRKMIIVAKKQSQNLDRLLDLFSATQSWVVGGFCWSMTRLTWPACDLLRTKTEKVRRRMSAPEISLKALLRSRWMTCVLP